MSWMTEGFDAAEKLAASAKGSRRKNRNFWTKPGEEAIIRFLKPAKETVNFKRAFVPWAKGQKLYTSPGTTPDPLLEAGLSLQAAFAWPILDRRVLEFEVEEEGKKVMKKVGPRFQYFADGQQTRKALIALEATARKDLNEERAEEGKDPLSEADYNLTHFDIRISKADKGWNLTPVRGGRPKPLSDQDKEIIEKYVFNIAEEIAPLGVAELRAIVSKDEPTSQPEAATSYSYGDDGDDTSNAEAPSFFGED